MMKRLVGTVALVAVFLAAPGSAQQEPEPAGWAYRYFGEVMSPFCPGRTLSACTSPQADSLRMWILVQEAAGRSQADVNAELIERYGDVILSAPRARGFGVAAYAIPGVVFLAGGLLVVVFLRRQTRAVAESAAPPPAEPVDSEIERIIDEELER